METLLAPAPSSTSTSASARIFSEQRLTAQEFRALDFEDETLFYELLHGEVVKRSAPSLAHQRITRNIGFAMHIFALNNHLGEILLAPADVALDDENVLQPDVFFIAAKRSDVATGEYVQGAPDLVVEVVSMGTAKRDRGDKMKLYERCGVREYWLVDARTHSVEIYTSLERDFELRELYAENHDMVRSFALEGFEMRLESVFEGV